MVKQKDGGKQVRKQAQKQDGFTSRVFYRAFFIVVACHLPYKHQFVSVGVFTGAGDRRGAV